MCVLCGYMCVCRLYKSLGDYDTVRGIFSSKVGTKLVTRQALEAEERGDFQEASHLYSDVSNRNLIIRMYEGS